MFGIVASHHQAKELNDLFKQLLTNNCLDKSLSSFA
jgi:hypothetical protein